MEKVPAKLITKLLATRQPQAEIPVFSVYRLENMPEECRSLEDHMAKLHGYEVQDGRITFDVSYRVPGTRYPTYRGQLSFTVSVNDNWDLVLVFEAAQGEFEYNGDPARDRHTNETNGTSWWINLRVARVRHGRP